VKFNLQKKTGLAVDALHALKGRTEPVGSEELATEIGTTQPFLPQVMSPLVKAGWVVSKRGPTGGYLLVADPGEISTLDLIEAVEGSTNTTTCVLRGVPCGTPPHCALHEPWKAARTALLDELESVPVLTITHPKSER
jgi:Rrf2 family protein